LSEAPDIPAATNMWALLHISAITKPNRKTSYSNVCSFTKAQTKNCRYHLTVL